MADRIKKRYTMKDVAERAGVSQPTVSHVINGTASISQSVKDRVNSIIKELDYRPNGIAKCLKTTKTNIIGVLIPDLFNEFYTMLVRTLETKLQGKGYVTLLSSTGYDPVSETRCIESLTRYNVEGIIICYQLLNRDLYAQLDRANIPFVKIEDGTNEFPDNSVDVDNINSGYIATDFLIQKGYRRIAFVSEAMRVHAMQHRLEGYLKALKENGIEQRDDMIITSDMDIDKTSLGMSLGDRVLESGAEAVFVTSDSVAVGLLRFLREHGKRVPDDIAVVSNDDTPAAKFTYPMLTTVEQPVEEITDRAMEIILAHINGEDAVPADKIRGSLVIRETA